MLSPMKYGLHRQCLLLSFTQENSYLKRALSSRTLLTCNSSLAPQTSFKKNLQVLEIPPHNTIDSTYVAAIEISNKKTNIANDNNNNYYYIGDSTCSSKSTQLASSILTNIKENHASNQDNSVLTTIESQKTIPVDFLDGNIEYPPENSKNNFSEHTIYETALPAAIVQELDSYIIGQEEAKKSLAVGLRGNNNVMHLVPYCAVLDRWRRQQIADTELRAETTPNNLLLIGPSGCGKTELARRVAQFCNAPFVKVVATRFTEVGFVGDDTQSMIHDLAEKAYADEKQRQKLQVSPSAKTRAQNYILKEICVTLSTQHLEPDLILTELQNGKLDSIEINVDSDLLQVPSERPRHPFQQMMDSVGGRIGGGFGCPTITAVPIGIASNSQLADMFINQLGLNGNNSKKQLSNDNDKVKKRKRIRVGEAMPLIHEHFIAEMIDEDAIIISAKHAAENRGIIFIDEFDKLIEPKDNQEFRAKRRGVQKELLSLMEGTSVSTRIGRICTDHILFIASGAFLSSKPSDVMPELQGRLPICTKLNPLTANDLKRILTETKFNLLKQQIALLQAENVTLFFTDAAIDKIAHIAYELNTIVANVGARRLKTVVAKLLEDIKYHVHRYKGQTVTIDEPMVIESLVS